MRASVNDRLVVRSHHVGDPDREAVILEVHGEDGEPPYLVRWIDGHETITSPSKLATGCGARASTGAGSG